MQWHCWGAPVWVFWKVREIAPGRGCLFLPTSAVLKVLSSFCFCSETSQQGLGRLYQGFCIQQKTQNPQRKERQELIPFDSGWSFPSCSHLPCHSTCASSSWDSVHIIGWESLEKWFKDCHFWVLELFSHKANFYSTPLCGLSVGDSLPASSHLEKLWWTIVSSVIMVIGKVPKTGGNHVLHSAGWLWGNIDTTPQTSLSSHRLATRTCLNSRTPISTVWETGTVLKSD